MGALVAGVGLGARQRHGHQALEVLEAGERFQLETSDGALLTACHA